MKDQPQNYQREASDGKKTPYLVGGSMLLLLGAWMVVGNIRFVLHGLRMGTLVAWEIADTALRFAVAAFFILVGARAIRRVSQEVPGTKIGWGRLLSGVVLIYIQMRGHFVPSPGALRPDNESQAIGMQFMSALIYLAGAALIVAAFLKKKRQAKVQPEQTNAPAIQS